MGTWFWVLVGINATAAAVILSVVTLEPGAETASLLVQLAPLAAIFAGGIAAVRAGYRPLGYFLLLVLAVPAVVGGAIVGLLILFPIRH